MYKIGDNVKCVNDKVLAGNDAKPDLTLDKEYPVKGITLDSAGNQHLDVGLESHLNWVRSYETGENLPDGDKIHWCHPSRFELVS
jgi:hypothetical protein